MDAGGNLTQRESIYPTSETESFTYDFLDRLTGASGSNYSESFTYDEIGNMTSKDGVAYSYGENGTGPHAVTAIGDNTYTYDDNGNMTARGSQIITWDVENRPVSVSLNGSESMYEYQHDDTNCTGMTADNYFAQTFTPQTEHTITKVVLRMYNNGATEGDLYVSIRATTATGEPTGPDLTSVETYPVSNMPASYQNYTFTFASGCILQAGTQYAIVMTADDATLYNKLAAIPGAYTGGDYLYSYDGTNWTHRSTYDLWFEEWGVTVSSTTSFVYDGDGNRVKKTEGGETILYINSYYEKNITTGVVTTNYYLGSKLIATCKDSTLTYVHQDALTGTSVTTNSSGTSTGSIKYFCFGSTRSGTVTTPQKFTGQRLDSTGLYYYGARYYDPEIGRFISADTIVSNPANPQSLNRYSYCLNNPLKYIDPSGHDQVITSTGTTNADGQEGYFICDGAGNLLGVAYGLDDLAAKSSALESQSRGVDLPVTKKTVTTTTTSSTTAYSSSTTSRSVVDTIVQKVFDTIGQNNTSINTKLGNFLGSISGGTSRTITGGITIYEGVNPNSPTGKLINALGAEAFTVGYTVLTGDPQIQPATLEHELGHVTQYGILGPYFLPIYGICAIGGWDNNPMEHRLLPNWPRR